MLPIPEMQGRGHNQTHHGIDVGTTEKASTAVAGVEKRRGRKCRCSLLAGVDEVVGEEMMMLAMRLC